MGRAGLGAVSVIAVGTLWACAGAPPAPEAPDGQVGARAAVVTPAPADEAFVVGKADAERKAKLVGLSARLDEVYRARFEEAKATAAVVGVVLEGELVYARAFGVRDVTTGAGVDVDSVFRIGSLTKSFTASAIAKLRDAGKLDLDAPAERYLPELAKVRGASPAAPMTVRHLLTMTSGLPYDDTWGPVTFGWNADELRAFLASGAELLSAPGDRYAYSNLGYALLGQIVERVSGLGFREYLERELLRPLGMSSSGWQAREQARLAIGYFLRDGKPLEEPRPDDGVFAPAGGLYTTLHDYARYAAFQLSAYAEEPGGGPLRSSSVRELHRGHAWMRWGDDVPVASRERDGKLGLNAASYGFGWVNLTTCNYEGLVQHGGFEPGYFAVARLMPRDGLAVVAFSTTASVGDKRTFERALGVLREGGLLRGSNPVSPELTRAGANVSRLFERWDRELARATFDPDSAKYSFIASIEQSFERLRGEHGACRPAGAIVASSSKQGRFLMNCERGSVQFSLLLSPVPGDRLQLLEWRANEPLPTPGATCSE
jgi:CubicO group peptidase (beta-lactamase class C family)